MNTHSAIQQLKDQGWCRIDGVIPPEAFERCYYDGYRILTTCGVISPAYPYNGSWQLRALELLEDVIDPAKKDEILQEQFYIRPAYINDVQSFAPYLADERLMAVVNAAIGSDPHVWFTTLSIHEPGTKRGPWHGGGLFNPLYAACYPAPYEKAEAHLTVHLLESDFSEENGGLLVVPASHRRMTNPAFEPREKRFAKQEDEVRITGPVGSAVIVDSRVWQAISPNDSDFPRMSVILELAPGSTNRMKFPKMPQGVFNRLPPFVKPLFRGWVK